MYNHCQISSWARNQKSSIFVPEPICTVTATLHKLIPAAYNHSVHQFGSPPVLKNTFGRFPGQSSDSAFWDCASKKVPHRLNISQQSCRFQK